ncbi:MAG: hypothetical protein JSW47_20990, partial [Phycisphaerales bacterium]
MINKHFDRFAKHRVITLTAAIKCLAVLNTLTAVGQDVDRFGFFETSFKATGQYTNPYTDL